MEYSVTIKAEIKKLVYDVFWKRNSKHNNELDSGDEDKDMSRIPYCSLSWE